MNGIGSVWLFIWQCFGRRWYFGPRLWISEIICLKYITKNSQKTDHSIAIYSNFWIGMVYFGCHLVNPHVQTVQNMYCKGRWRVCKARLRPPRWSCYLIHTMEKRLSPLRVALQYCTSPIMASFSWSLKRGFSFSNGYVKSESIMWRQSNMLVCNQAQTKICRLIYGSKTG